MRKHKHYDPKSECRYGSVEFSLLFFILQMHIKYKRPVQEGECRLFEEVSTYNIVTEMSWKKPVYHTRKQAAQENFGGANPTCCIYARRQAGRMPPSPVLEKGWILLDSILSPYFFGSPKST